VKVLSRRERIEAAGGLVVAVVNDPPERVRAGMLHDLDLPWPVVVDLDRRAYRDWGLGRASLLRTVIAPTWIAGYARRVVGGGERVARPGRDPMQLGGDFVVDPKGIVVFAHPQRGFDDRPPAGELVRALEAAAG
jgi:hypothetical protein